MLQVDGRDYLYLIWKSEQSRTQYIVGQLVKNGQYEFRYAKEVQAALNDGFTPLLCFPDVQKVYTDQKLFPVFASRLPDKRRKDIQGILKKYDLEQYDEYLLLKRGGARLPIDNFEFIPASNEPSGCLQTFGDCREGQIPRCSAALQV